MQIVIKFCKWILLTKVKIGLRWNQHVETPILGFMPCFTATIVVIMHGMLQPYT